MREGSARAEAGASGRPWRCGQVGRELRIIRFVDLFSYIIVSKFEDLVCERRGAGLVCKGSR